MADKINGNSANTDKETKGILSRIFKVNFKGSNKRNALPSDLIDIYNLDTDEEGRVQKIYDALKDDEVKSLFDAYMTHTKLNFKKYENMLQLYEDMDELYNNCPPIAKAIDMIRDEAIPIDEITGKLVTVTAKRQLRVDIENFLNKINVNKLLRETAHDTILYGNDGWIPEITPDGVESVIQADVRLLKEPLKFKPSDVEKDLVNKQWYSDYSSFDRVSAMMDLIKDKNNNVTYFKEYLIGYHYDERILPPWSFIHIANRGDKNPFSPFGIPFYIHSFSAYKRYEYSLSLQSIARGLMFPIDRYSLKSEEGGNPTTKAKNLLKLKQFLENLGFGNIIKDKEGLGRKVFDVQDLFEYEQITPDIDLGKIDDIELLKDDVVISTEIPRELIDSADGGFGDSGVALREKFKPFARMIWYLQSLLLESLTKLVTIHLIHTKKYSMDDIDFSLALPFPERFRNDDNISQQSDLIELTNDLKDMIMDNLTDGEPLPRELLLDIYKQFLPYADTDIEKWFKLTEPPTEEEFEEKRVEYLEFRIKLNESLKKRKQNIDKFMDDSLTECIQKNIMEGFYGGKHMYSSRNTLSGFNPKDLIEYDKKVLKKYKDSKEKFQEYLEKPEEAEYKFKSNIDEGE